MGRSGRLFLNLKPAESVVVARVIVVNMLTEPRLPVDSLPTSTMAPVFVCLPTMMMHTAMGIEYVDKPDTAGLFWNFSGISCFPVSCHLGR